MFSLILWCVVGILQVISCLCGTPNPTWLQYWCVYICLIIALINEKSRKGY